MSISRQLGRAKSALLMGSAGVVLLLMLLGSIDLLGTSSDAERTPSVDLPSSEGSTGAAALDGTAGSEGPRSPNASPWGGLDRDLVQLYSATSWTDVLNSTAAPSYASDRRLLLESVRSICTAGRYAGNSGIPSGLAEINDARRSLAMVVGSAQAICDNVNLHLIDEAVSSIDEQDGAMTGGERPGIESIDQLIEVKSPADFLSAGVRLADRPFLHDVEASLGMPNFSADRQQTIRIAAIAEARCRLFPGCAPGGILATAACLPDRCSAGHSFSVRFMDENLTVREQLVAVRLATSIVSVFEGR